MAFIWLARAIGNELMGLNLDSASPEANVSGEAAFGCRKKRAIEKEGSGWGVQQARTATDACERCPFGPLNPSACPGSHRRSSWHCLVYLNGNTSCNFGPFCPPKRASGKAFKIRSCDGMYELSFKFLGGGYLKLRVNREMVFINPYSASFPAPPAAAPEVFEFVGIRRDREKEKAERQERMTSPRRSPSPRESWFEINHPMGS
ncbi:hypothetical protein AYO21_12119 [Fonsecaea monophora]|uniref:Uncharacterized protein n=1 Tax=Fonsecaea monophora TaxID=254056 RepID=A0A177ES30_9EURO|nr:hypothetical protein AYO21_12119 [Fonsecaea monophora]OAG33789.1 hypothetical protein AYO21_12119 [Fonsecaea monophora]